MTPTEVLNAAELGTPRLKMLLFVIQHRELDEQGFTGLVEFNLSNHKAQVNGRVVQAARQIRLDDASDNVERGD